MFTVAERESLRAEILAAAQADDRISGAAITGSASIGNEDRWSDIDLAFGVHETSKVEVVLTDFTQRMFQDHGAVHSLDVRSGEWIYRVFLLPSSLQVDLAFASARDFGARGTTFRLVFGEAVEPQSVSSADAESLVAWAWLYALHVRSSLARGKLWQAEFMIHGMRDTVLSLACVRRGLPSHQGRGLDQLPEEDTIELEASLVHSLDAGELRRSYGVVMAGLRREIVLYNSALAARLEPAFREL